MRYKDGINVGFSRGLKGKWKKSRINQNSTAVVFFCGTSPLTMSWLRVRNSFFSNIFLYFSSLELFSLSLARLNFYVCARFFFSKRSKVRPRLGQWSVAGLVSLLLAFFRTLRVILFFFLLAQFIGLFFPRIFPSSSGPDATRLDVRQDVAMATIDGVSLEERNGVIRPVFWLALLVKTLPFDFTSILRTVCRVFW